MDSWPTSLPLPMIGSTSDTSPRGGQTMMETGRIRKRRLHVDPFRLINVQWVFQADQFAAFKTFFDETLSNGASSFVLTVYGEDVVVAFMEGKYASTHSDNNSVVVNGSLQIITTLSVYLALSGTHVSPVLRAGAAEDQDALLQSGITYGG